MYFVVAAVSLLALALAALLAVYLVRYVCSTWCIPDTVQRVPAMYSGTLFLVKKRYQLFEALPTVGEMRTRCITTATVVLFVA